MSYSFTVVGASKEAVLDGVAKKLQEVVASQPVHAKDADMAQDTAATIVAKMKDDAARDLSVNVCGSIWDTPEGTEQCSISVGASFAVRQ